jgi:arylsulfatase A-like enzyme
MPQLSRRDFLKTAGVLLAGSLASRKLLSLGVNHEKPNIILFLCDALSASHLSLHGYPRLTTPNLDAFAEKSTVFHTHYSGGNFTTTGTASMLTGMTAWKHRAINQGGLIRAEFARNNPYTLLGSDYHRFAYSQNPWSDRLVGQSYNDVDRFLLPAAYSLINENPISVLFERDRTLTSIAIEDFLFPTYANMPGSLMAGYVNKSRVLLDAEKQKSAFARYPNGIPEIMIEGYLAPFLNEDVYDGVYLELSQLQSESTPYFAYFHLFSPHSPYKPRRDFNALFHDDYSPVAKPIHPLSPGLDKNYMLTRRTLYDRQIAQVDQEFGKLISRLDEIGVLDNSYLIFTSDHGELFERGYVGHGFQFMYEPVLHIPLIIHAPRQVKREDVFSLTSNIDILPTILSIAGKGPAPDVDGSILPGFGGQVDEDRPVFSIFAVDNPAFNPIKKAVITMHKGAYKLIAYLGYESFDQVFELYDLENDPEEMVDLVSKDVKTLSALKDELFSHLDEANKPFTKKRN